MCYLVFAVLAIAVSFMIVATRSFLWMLEPGELQRAARIGSPWARRVMRLVTDPQRVSKGMEMALELVFLWGGIATLKYGSELGEVGAFIIVPYLGFFLLFGEYVPERKVIMGLRLSPSFIAPWIQLSMGVSWPWLKLRALLHEAFGVKGDFPGGGGCPMWIREEIAWKIRSREERASHYNEERKMIERILRFSGSKVKEVMIPLVEMCAVEELTPVEQVIKLIKDEGYSRLPVYRERIDNVVGMIRALDLLSVCELKEPVRDYVRPVTFVPESMPVDRLLVFMKREGQHLAMVVDEYGGTVGLITLEDLIEEIVGQIEDEYDVEEPRIKWISSMQAVVDARTEIEELNEKLGLGLPKGDYETLAGLILDVFKKIPSPGDSIVMGNVRFTVRKTSERSIEEVLVTIPRHSRK